MKNIPYGRQTIDDSDVEAVARALRSDWLTQGPRVAEFERDLAAYCGAKHAVVFANGTLALQAAYFAAGVKEGDEVVTTPITFAATATAALWQGAKVVFADVDPETGNLDPREVERKLTERTRVLAPVDFSGRPADLAAFQRLAKDRGLVVVEDACHALGGTFQGRRIGSIADLTVFSFHPVKSITTGEGGAVLTDDPVRAEAMAKFRMHGIARGEDWEYAVEEQATNCRLTDIQCALGSSQLRRLDRFIERRRAIARRYRDLLRGLEGVTPPPPSDESSWHLYVVQIQGPEGRRREVFRGLRERGIGVQVHYIPVYRHPLYRRLGFKAGLCPKAEAYYERILSLPIFPALTDGEQDQVVAALKESLKSPSLP